MPESVPGYRDLARIGQGGFSMVYRAHQETFDRTVALKVLRMASDDEVHRRFLREVKLTGRLSGHPHVVTILDAGSTESGQPYLATELYEGGSLKDRLRDDGPLPPAEVAAIGAKIADALGAAHALGIVHRDVKPGNILLSRFGEPALADFGVGCLLDAAASNSVLDSFSPHHAAPEVVSRSAPSAASDVYSLGSTLYELLTGQPAFGGEGTEIAAVLWQIVHEPAPATRCPELPGLAAAIDRALSKEPEDRQESAAAFARELRALIQPEPGRGAAAVVAGQSAVPASAVQAYVSAFEPVAAAGGPPRSGEPPQSAQERRRQRWPLFAGLGFALTVLVSLVAALLWTAPSKGSAATQAAPGQSSNGLLGSATGPNGGTNRPGSPGASSSAGLGGVGVGTTLPPGASRPVTVGSTTPAAAVSGVATTGVAAGPVITTAASGSTEPTTKTCTGWTAPVNSNAAGTPVGNDNLRPGPYMNCTALTKLKVADAVDIWCSVVNTNGVAWVYVEVGGSIFGWVPKARMTLDSGTISPC